MTLGKTLTCEITTLAYGGDGIARVNGCVLDRNPLTLTPWIRHPDHTTCLVDPPRSGLASAVTDAIIKSACRRVIYVSCDPATLARDLARFITAGYILTRVRLFDMFPRTAHFETVAELYRKP